MTTLRVALKAAEDVWPTSSRPATSASSLSKMLTRAELYDLLGYTGYEERDRAYFGG